MKATEAQLLKFIDKSPQFIIPIYQRPYSWTNRECLQLWEDILRTGRNDAIESHFAGSIVYIEKGLYQVSNQSSLLVIDGQQRLTTVMLILEALARQVKDGEPENGFSAKKLRNYYLLNSLEEGEGRFKLLLTQTDKQTLLALVQQHPPPEDKSIRITENFAFFEKKIQRLEASEIKQLCRGLSKLTVVDIALSRDHDNPQLIFESMNSTGRELTQADLIRNYILMGLESKEQEYLYKTHWRPMEIAFGQEAYGTHFDKFVRHYLTYKTGEIPNIRSVYDAFKQYAHSPEVKATGVDSLVAEIHKHADHYCAMAMGKEQDPSLSQAFRDLQELKVDVTFPFLLELYSDYEQGLLPKLDFVEAVRLIEAYIFRRAVCAIPTPSHSKTFATFGREVQKDRYLQSIQAILLKLPSYRRFPTDIEFKRELSERDLYNFPRRSYWLRRLENFGRKERVPVDDYTIEHIMPQNKNLSTSWREVLGSDWQNVQEKWLHTIGNLSLTGYNSEYSDHSFAKKRDMKGGFRESPLWLNEGLSALDYWNEDTIRQRAERLVARAVRVWEPPDLPSDILATFNTKKDLPHAYTFDDHRHLTSDSPMRPLFDAFRREVLALDPGTYEVILKTYVAYKAETNFVDVQVFKGYLRLILNLRFHELHDPRGWARDVTNVGHFGNGDAGIDLETFSQLPYVMGLVRQAFEIQMGNDMMET